MNVTRSPRYGPVDRHYGMRLATNTPETTARSGWTDEVPAVTDTYTSIARPSTDRIADSIG